MTVPAESGKHAVVGYGKIQLSLSPDSFAVAVKDAMDRADLSIQESFESSNAGSKVENCRKLLDGGYTALEVVAHNNGSFSYKRTSPKAIFIKKDGDESFFLFQIPYSLLRHVTQLMVIKENGC